MYSCLLITLIVLNPIVLKAKSAPVAYFGLTSSSYLNRVPVVSSPLHEIKLSSTDCARSCMTNANCWSWYVYSANGTSNCVLIGTNQCREPTLTFRTAPSANTIWWEKMLAYPTACANRSLLNSSSSYFTTNVASTAIITTTSTSIPTLAATTPTTVSTPIPSTTSSTLPTAPPPTCNATTCVTCKQCTAIGGGVPGPSMLDFSGSIICKIWPNGPLEDPVTLLCLDNEKPVFVYRKVAFNTTNVTEYVVDPEQMYFVLNPYFYSYFEIRFKTRDGYTKVSQYKLMFLDIEGRLTLDGYVQYDKDLVGVPIYGASFVNSSEVDPACGPFWDLQNSPVANNGTAFGGGICPGYLTAFYGKPGFYNGAWSSGISFPSYRNDVILEILAYFW